MMKRMKPNAATGARRLWIRSLVTSVLLLCCSSLTYATECIQTSYTFNWIVTSNPTRAVAFINWDGRNGNHLHDDAKPVTNILTVSKPYKVVPANICGGPWDNSANSDIVFSETVAWFYALNITSNSNAESSTAHFNLSTFGSPNSITDDSILYGPSDSTFEWRYYPWTLDLGVGSYPETGLVSVGASDFAKTWYNISELLFNQTWSLDSGVRTLPVSDSFTFFYPVPEPGSLLLFGTSVLGLSGLLRRKLR